MGWSPPTELPSGARRLAWQWEIAPDTGRRHCQAYLALTTPQKPTAFMKAMAMTKNARNAWHFEERRGTEEQAVEYCTKEDTRMDGTYYHSIIKWQMYNQSEIHQMFDDRSQIWWSANMN